MGTSEGSCGVVTLLHIYFGTYAVWMLKKKKKKMCNRGIMSHDHTEVLVLRIYCYTLHIELIQISKLLHINSSFHSVNLTESR